jgi:hypothetical protein
MRWCAVVLVALASVVFDAPTAAAQDPYDCMEELEDSELDARLQLVDRRLQAGKRGARAWWYGWQALFGGVFGYQLASAITSEPGSERWATTIGTVGAFLALAQMWIIPQPAAYAPQRYRRMPEGSRAERVAKLRYGLDRLETAAARETLGRGVLAHATPIVWSAVWATTLSLKFDDPGRVALLVVGGFVITQARIWTTPQRAIRDWSELRWTICEHAFVRRLDPDERHVEPGQELDEEGNLESEDLVDDGEDEGPEAHFVPSLGGGSLFVVF